jgi:phosphoglucomutase
MRTSLNAYALSVPFKLYEKSLEIQSFKTISGSGDVDLNAPAGSTYQLTATSTVTIIDPFQEYIDVLKTCFDFDALRKFAKRPGFSLLFDAMHGAGGPFARRVFLEELGLPEVRNFSSIAGCLSIITLFVTYFSRAWLVVSLAM